MALRFAEDYEMLLRFLARAPLMLVDRVFFRYYPGGKSATYTRDDLAARYEIRSYYAQAFGVQVENLSASQMLAQRQFIDIRSAIEGGELWRAARVTAASVVSNPAAFGSTLRAFLERRLRRNFSAEQAKRADKPRAFAVLRRNRTDAR